MRKAVWSGLKEVRLGEVAQEQALSPEVRDFATRMVMDHQKANERLAELARLKGLTIPETNSLDQPYAYKPAGEAGATGITRDEQIRRDEPATRNVVNAELPPREEGKDNTIPDNKTGRLDQKRYTGELAFDEIRKLSGAEFDRAFMSQMIADHNRAVGLFSKASQELEDVEIKAFALETLPKLREHLRDAERISTEITRSNF